MRVLSVRQQREPRVFCTLSEAAVFLGLSYNAARKRHQRGTLAGVARAIDGSLWCPAGRSQVLVEASALRHHLNQDARVRFDAWLEGRLSLATVKRQLRQEQSDGH
jgi:hypothetical protein